VRRRHPLVPVVAVLALLAPAGVAQATTPVPPTPVGWPVVLSASQTAPTQIMRGVTAYSETYTTVDGPERTQVLRVDLGGRVELDAVEAHDHIIDPPDEATTSMGDRTGAVAGINGDFFAIHASGAPLGGVVRDGRLLKTPRVHFAGQLSVAGGTARIGEIDFTGRVRLDHSETALDSVNTLEDATAGRITEITPDLGSTAPIPGAAPVADMVPATPPAATPLALIPVATLVIAHTRGHRTDAGVAAAVVDEVRPAATSVPALGPDQVALLGGGAGGDWLAAHAKVGSRLSTTADLLAQARRDPCQRRHRSRPRRHGLRRPHRCAAQRPQPGDDGRGEQGRATPPARRDRRPAARPLHRRHAAGGRAVHGRPRRGQCAAARRRRVEHAGRTAARHGVADDSQPPVRRGGGASGGERAVRPPALMWS